ncbi:leucine rich repeat domain protein [Reticulomyxa filosa]|uniref:Leucine rich repeat domain protein n=1 Tax=Reticulomyxa filosa TaxID=46433 RepID=X6P3E2_RETFI|nr:leucine rich repeat domain protein [Reticulomyxa filosa]|eukprot:ETO33060.1 leucine rich repeat domain protein [Reticulomyxa filosa]
MYASTKKKKKVLRWSFVCIYKSGSDSKTEKYKTMEDALHAMNARDKATRDKGYSYSDEMKTNDHVAIGPRLRKTRHDNVSMMTTCTYVPQTDAGLSQTQYFNATSPTHSQMGQYVGCWMGETRLPLSLPADAPMLFCPTLPQTSHSNVHALPTWLSLSSSLHGHFHPPVQVPTSMSMPGFVPASMLAPAPMQLGMPLNIDMNVDVHTKTQINTTLTGNWALTSSTYDMSTSQSSLSNVAKAILLSIQSEHGNINNNNNNNNTNDNNSSNVINSDQISTSSLSSCMPSFAVLNAIVTNPFQTLPNAVIEGEPVSSLPSGPYHSFSTDSTVSSFSGFKMTSNDVFDIASESKSSMGHISNFNPNTSSGNTLVLSPKWTIEQRKMGDIILADLKTEFPNHASKLTGMLLCLPKEKLDPLVANKSKLKAIARKFMELLDN